MNSYMLHKSRGDCNKKIMSNNHSNGHFWLVHPCVIEYYKLNMYYNSVIFDPMKQFVQKVYYFTALLLLENSATLSVFLRNNSAILGYFFVCTFCSIFIHVSGCQSAY